MQFPTTAFAIFYASVLLLWWALPAKCALARKLLLLAASMFFYAWWSPPFALLLLASAAVNHAFAVAISRHCAEGAPSLPQGGPSLPQRRPVIAAKRLVCLAVAANLVLLAFFKYTGFLLLETISPAAASVCRALGPGALQSFIAFQNNHTIPFVQSIVLPIGISFTTFQAIAYVVDAGRGACRPARSVLDFANYLAFFPKLCAGPIARPAAMLPQMEDLPGRDTRVDAGRAVWLIVFGLFKKTVLANFLAERLVDPFFAHAGVCGAADALLGAWGYAVQLYLDFSAYTDMAVGMALLLGFELPVNFDAPYFSRTLQEFWRRWHISLSSWLRDYLYIPLGGSRRGAARTYLNLFLTMLLGGLWHGAGWMFLLWGGLHGAYLAAERLVLRSLPHDRRPAPAALALLQRVWVFHVATFLWIFFRAGTGGIGLAGAGEVFGAFARFSTPSVLLSAMAIAVLVAGFLCQLADAHRPRALWDAFNRLPVAVQGLVAAVLLTIVLGLGPAGVPAFIYNQF